MSSVTLMKNLKILDAGSCRLPNTRRWVDENRVEKNKAKEPIIDRLLPLQTQTWWNISVFQALQSFTEFHTAWISVRRMFHQASTRTAKLWLWLRPVIHLLVQGSSVQIDLRNAESFREHIGSDEGMLVPIFTEL